MSDPLTDADVPAWWQALGLPGLFDVHVHFLPPNIQAAVYRQFDQAGPKIGRDWPIRYRGSHEERVAQLRALGVRRFSALPYAHKPGVAAYLNEWAADFAAQVPECLWSATFYPEPGVGEAVGVWLPGEGGSNRTDIYGGVRHARRRSVSDTPGRPAPIGRTSAGVSDT